MSEWLKEHAWKTNPATLTERYRITSSRNRFNDFPPQNASRCEPVNVGICRRFRGDLTQFLHSSERHFWAYSVMFVGTRQTASPFAMAPFYCWRPTEDRSARYDTRRCPRASTSGRRTARQAGRVGLDAQRQSTIGIERQVTAIRFSHQASFRPAAPEHPRHRFQFFLPPSCNASNAFSTLSEPETWLGGNSLNVARNWPMIIMAGIMTHNFLPHHSP